MLVRQTEPVDVIERDQSVNEMLSVLAAALRLERFGQDFYLDMSGCVRDERGKEVMRRLAGDEKGHYDEIMAQIDDLWPGMDPEAIDPDWRLLEIINERAFPAGGREECLSIDDEIRAIEYGILLEVNSINMYNRAANLSTDYNVIDLLEGLASWETKHLNILEENLHALKGDRRWIGFVPVE